MHHQGYEHAQTALAEIIEDMLKSRQRLNEAEYQFLESTGYQNLDLPAQRAARVLIQGCKNLILGNLKWS